MESPLNAKPRRPDPAGVRCFCLNALPQRDTLLFARRPTPPAGTALMLKRVVLFGTVAAAFALALYAASEKPAVAQKPAIPDMKFNDVVEIAPGVFFRYSSISASDPKIPFGGS